MTHPAILAVINITGIDPMQPSRKLVNARAKQLLMYTLRYRYGLKTAEVARFMGLSGHSRVVHSCNRLTAWMRHYPHVREQVEYCMKVVIY